ncbi:MAG: hypothetical protein KIT73_19170 [Burkholderiales bacterium]|nr:hypothetical protein [Burkholderiales bacterium]
MIVGSSSVAMESTWFSETRREVAETLRVTARRAADVAMAPTAAAPTDAAGAVGDGLSPELALLKAFVERLTGREVRLFSLQPASAGAGGAAAAQPQDSGPIVEYERVERLVEHERTSFAAAGAVKLDDGREITFSMAFTMERLHVEESRVAFSNAPANRKDPLMLDLGGGPVQLSNVRFDFDLDADGITEWVPTTAGDTWILAFDRNDDGRVDDGRELFGPTTGNGFTELSRLDEDGNGWIDAGDTAYGRLMLWQPAASGTGRSMDLATAGIGALQTTAIETPFSIRDADNTELGLVRASAVYLKESGAVGALQQVDLTV